MIKEDKVLARITDECFVEAAKRETETPLESPSVKHFDEFVQLLNHIVTSVAPEFTVCKDPATGKYEPCGLIGFPINALLDWPMATSYGYVIFANELVNQQLKKILTYWTSFLTSPESTNVLIKDDFSNEPFAVGWLSDYARQHLVDVVLEASGTKVRPDATFEQIFQCDPSSQAHGYKSWDDFFTRLFRPGIRPVAEPQDLNVIVSACESAPLQNVTNVRLSDKFWLKGMPYSLQNMMDFHPLTEKFVGGTVYQAFLSALSYHRWNSPVSGTVVDAFVVDGTYYLENLHHGFKDHRPDAAAPNDSQPFLASVATRAVIFLEADSPDIGLMCFIGVGMAEVSSCEITVKTGDRVNKGDELGMFHFGGSTHCLCFRKETKLDFIRPDVVGLDAKNIAVGSYLARASS
jgi:phosphatidylserine decarboxylase